MLPADRPLSQDPLAERVIDELYEVAVDPTRYEVLLDHWERLIAPHRNTANSGAPPVMSLPEFETHFQRADRVLRDVTVPLSELTPGQVLARIERSAAFCLGDGARVTLVNPVASAAFGIGSNADLGALPLAEGEAQTLREAALRCLRANRDETAILCLRGASRDRTVLFSLRRLTPRGACPSSSPSRRSWAGRRASTASCRRLSA